MQKKIILQCSRARENLKMRENPRCRCYYIISYVTPIYLLLYYFIYIIYFILLIIHTFPISLFNFCQSMGSIITRN